MKNILRLTWRDMRRATSNTMAIIVMFGLVVIPSLFTWFNVIASWDPFANTRDLTVAVASVDEGYQSDLIPIRTNVGEQVLSALRANKDLNWVITSESDAIAGTKTGEYYAAIVLPKTFSADMLTFYADGGKSTHLDYYVNEKKNALAPKITGQGAEGVSSQISEVFTKTLGDVSLALISSMSDFLNSGDTQAALTRLESRVATSAAHLRSGAQTATMFTAVIRASLPLVDSASSLITSSGAALDDASAAASNGGAAVGALQSSLASAASALDDALTSTAAGYDAVGDRVDELFAKLDAVSGSQGDVLRSMAERVQEQIDAYQALRTKLDTEVRPLLPEKAQLALDAVIARLDEAIARQQSVHDRLLEAAADVAAGNDRAQHSHQAITDAIAQAKKALQDAKDAYTGNLKPQLDALSDTLSGITNDVSTIKGDLDSAASRLSGSAGTVRDVLTSAEATSTKLADTLQKTAGKFDALQAALAKSADTGDLSDLRKIIGADPEALASSLASPVRVDRTPVFPLVSFGAGMAPLYTVLALWVGALLMTVAIRTDVRPDVLGEGVRLTPTQHYLGRYGIFAATGLAQSTLLTLGLLLFVQIQPAHPFLLLLAAWVTTLVFTLLIYTAVLAFGNAGKALAVLFLVIQISGSGGAYPLQLLPAWFQNISPFLPATHAVNAIRAAVAGIYDGDYWIQLGLLALFLVPALLLGLVLRRPLMSFTQGLSTALESTKLM
ncbi:YhgE/Pip domain-containing protein [Microbacterium gorillae]|uniref:YhgE/Pip domain-containing protein n=1 Tax=Microbacterium gorillae TaxID=1231063 RepID=UPI000590FF8B|nr:YhgE/Pip domain-containing protein [Microbacterium gorillae]